jgi:hypothetical protein
MGTTRITQNFLFDAVDSAKEAQASLDMEEYFATKLKDSDPYVRQLAYQYAKEWEDKYASN